MIKSIFIERCKKQNINIPFEMIIDIYDDEDDIPNDLLRALFCPGDPKIPVLYMNAAFREEFNKAINDYIDEIIK